MNRKDLKQFGLQCIFYIAFFVLVVIIFAFFDLGLKWDNLSVDNFDGIGYFTLVLFRIIIYVFPAIFFKIVFRSKCKITRCYGYQFGCYSIMLAIFNLLSFDYVFGIDIFSKLDSFAFLLGLVLSFVCDKKLSKDVTDKFE